MRQTPEEIFLLHIKKLITNLLIENPNYETDSIYSVVEKTQERAKYILEEIERTEHLIKE